MTSDDDLEDDFVGRDRGRYVATRAVLVVQNETNLPPSLSLLWCPARLRLVPPPLYKPFRLAPRRPGSLPSRPNFFTTLELSLDEDDE